MSLASNKESQRSGQRANQRPTASLLVPLIKKCFGWYRLPSQSILTLRHPTDEHRALLTNCICVIAMNAFSESKRLQLEANSAIADFVAVEIESGQTFCRIAKMEENDEHRHHSLEQARKAYRTAIKGIKKLKLSQTELGKLKVQLEHLEAALKSAAEGGESGKHEGIEAPSSADPENK